ncbi:RidA family protein [Enterovibrio norvegicus]|uniref:Reactive intermediate/imine deaminase n=1 Tax=Enterovibrio norvegicus TaxID=188144 RepID=A0A2N7L427_9GAMM|nr:Rid family hydrolase [Enterovibrio norvegicus]PML77133.1 reactive intermediate/imine deaminase [Enterovibrio norvegicus]PMN65713.1 reactive intermediate/imine deaminase [Enterovibrio norvegicus]PMN88126.1 reactive intermediate/imine deaminase [Enterovibrio norvegicus]
MNKLLTCVTLFFTMVISHAAYAKPNNNLEFFTSESVFPKSLNLPFAEAVRAGDQVYLTGQIGNIPGTLTLVEGGIEAEAKQVLNNVKSVLEANGLSMKDVAKCTVMMADISEWSTFNGIYKTFFDGQYPARSAFGANGLALGARVEVECFAIAP